MQIPPENNAAKYIQRLSAGIESQIDALRKAYPEEVSGLRISSLGLEREALHVEINSASDLWPRQQKNEEAIIGMVASSLTIDVWVRQQPIDPDKFVWMSGQADFEAHSVNPDRAILVWNRKASQLYISATAHYDRDLWRLSGKITSLPDLYGSQIFLMPNRYENPNEAAALITSLRPRMIFLTFAEGRPIYLPPKKLKKLIYDDTYPVFSITLPKDEAKFREFTTSTGED
jgi:hypothetical protein